MELEFADWIEIIRLGIVIMSGIAIPVSLFVVGHRYTRVRELEEKLREDRIEIYNKALEPYF